MAARERLVFGFMTGTSIDALDGAAVVITGNALEISARVAACVTLEFGPVAKTLRRIASGEPISASAIAHAALEAAQLHVRAVEQLARAAGRPSLIALHGQTVFHAPPASWQLVNPWPIARAAGCPVVYDLRAADLAAGGQGAPITPLADWVLFHRNAGAPTAIINLGGFCNITHLPAPRANESPTESIARVRGMDICACNQLLDAVARRALNAPYDYNGDHASRGAPDPRAATELISALDRQSAARRSLGTGDEAGAWLEAWITRLTPDTLAAAAASAIGTVIGRAAATGLRESAATVQTTSARTLCAGGGILNRALMRAIEQACGSPVETTDSLGVPPSHREAACMAILGALSQDGVPITLPAITGVRAPAQIAGSWANFGEAERRQSRDFQVALSRGEHAATSDASGAREARYECRGSESSAARASSPPPPNRAHIRTEQRNPRTMRLDSLSIEECVALLNSEDATVPAAVAQAAPAISEFIRAAEPRLREGGRLIYIGAGTSGRLGVLDASECPPTFQTPPERIVGIIAGGDSSLRRSSEGREDEYTGARAELDSLNLSDRDTILGIAAGATTPYVLGALEHARSLRALTAMLVCSPIDHPEFVDHLIYIPTGPEPLTGSTRMKAGTATKLALNTISTTLMVRLGKVYENLMVDLRATNSKLRDRAARIVTELTGLSRNESFTLLDQAGGSVKAAVVMRRRNLSRHAAEQLLALSDGRLRDALEGDAP